ncbi:MAG TPA: tetratricopeptide repeat protein [Vicinamibacteria bacterium]
MRSRTAVVVGAVMMVMGAGVAGADEKAPTPAERRMAEARQALEKKPSAEGWSELAMALARRARESSDVRFYEQAEDAVQRALALAPDHVEAQKARAWVLLGQHRFAEARDLAQVLNRRVPDDVMIYGLLTDAHVELGQYAEAEAACQWMLNLRPGNVPALTRAAYLRELFGEVEGALELMKMAFEQTPPAEREDLAWISTQVGHLELLAGRTAAAERALDGALELFPGYHYALAGLARVRTVQGRHAEAARLLQQRYDAAPHPENLFDLAEALQRAGRAREAQRAFASFEREALAESAGPDNANRELILYYVDHARRPAAALRLAQREASVRRDVYTLDALAWAQRASGRTTEARRTLQQALEVGVKDPRLLRHARALGAPARRG